MPTPAVRGCWGGQCCWEGPWPYPRKAELALVTPNSSGPMSGTTHSAVAGGSALMWQVRLTLSPWRSTTSGGSMRMVGGSAGVGRVSHVYPRVLRYPQPNGSGQGTNPGAKPIGVPSHVPQAWKTWSPRGTSTLPSQQLRDWFPSSARLLLCHSCSQRRPQEQLKGFPTKMLRQSREENAGSEGLQAPHICVCPTGVSQGCTWAPPAPSFVSHVPRVPPLSLSPHPWM